MKRKRRVSRDRRGRQFVFYGRRRQSTQSQWRAKKLKKRVEELLSLIVPGVKEKGNPLEMSEGVSKQPRKSS